MAGNGNGRGLARAHKLVGLAAGLVILTVAATGLLLQHPHLLGPPDARPTAYAADPERPGRWLRGSDLGLEISDDDGAAWREVPMLRPPDGVVRLAFDDGGAVWALGRDIVVVSRDGGTVWEHVDLPPAAGAVWRAPTDLVLAGDRVEIVTRAGLIRSDDGGASWTVVAWPGRVPERGLRARVRDLHTGWAFGRSGRDVVSVGTAALVVVTLTGFGLGALGRRRRNGG